MASGDRDDRVLPLTRGVAWFIVPFLIVAFAVLWPVPTDTDTLFAWHIVPTLTPMILGSAYLGGAYFFVRAGRASQWHAVKGGFIPVALFATLLGIATIIHWDKFHHGHVAFWLWSGLYFTTPFLVAYVYLTNRRHDPPAVGRRPAHAVDRRTIHRRRRRTRVRHRPVPVHHAGARDVDLAVAAHTADGTGHGRGVLPRTRRRRRADRPAVEQRPYPTPGCARDAGADPDRGHPRTRSNSPPARH